MNNLELTFYGGAESVTGSNFLLERKERLKDNNVNALLVDCGLLQGEAFAEEENHDSFAYDPGNIDVLLVTHAHIDHIGRIPKLINEGFSGDIISTPATRELAGIMYEDALSIMEYERKKEDKPVLYTRDDVEHALSEWKALDYYTDRTLDKDISVQFKDAGHILGSAIIEITYGDKKIVFTGDLGNSPSPLLRDTDTIDDARFMVMESVYGDRNHEEKGKRTQKLKQAAKKTLDRGGTLLIPAFSIERTQVLLYELNEMMEAEELPQVPTFLDSPLAIEVTQVYREKQKIFNQEAREDISGGDDIFSFPGLKMTETVEDSKEINDVSGPKIIIAGSGMSEGGRIVHHEKRYLPDEKSTLLIVGYQAPGSRGRKIQDGASEVKVHGDTIPVAAQVETVTGYSAHKDSEHLLEFASETRETAEKIFVAMGEPKSAAFLAQRIRDFLDVPAVVPRVNDSYTLTF